MKNGPARYVIPESVRMFILVPPATAIKTTTDFYKANQNLNVPFAHMKIQNLTVSA
jgi:hypothetical protein